MAGNVSQLLGKWEEGRGTGGRVRRGCGGSLRLRVLRPSMHMRLVVTVCATVLVKPVAPPVSHIAANDNTRPAGRLAGGVMTIRLEARAGTWHPEAEDGPSLQVQAFGEWGGSLQVPGPMIRVPEGTVIDARVRNAIPGATLVVHGLASRPDAGDSLV